METVIKRTIQSGNIEMPKEITDFLGVDIKSTCMNGAWLLLTNRSDNRFEGEPLRYDGTTYSLPANHMSAFNMSHGDTVRLVFSDVLNTVILQLLETDSQDGKDIKLTDFT